MSTDIIKYTYTGFYAGTIDNNHFITNIILSKRKNLLYTKNIDECDLIIIGSFLKTSSFDAIKNTNAKKILYVSEPLFSNGQRPVLRLSKHAFDNFKLNFTFGSIYDDNENNIYKFPIYIRHLPSKSNFDFFLEINSYVKNTDINNKNFCALINSHDRGNTRTNIHNKLSTIKKIDCPGKLFNNCSNEELNSIGKVRWLKNYLFNICPENFVCEENCGYITEKLMHACLAGTIPIYYGSKLDDIDTKIFNTNRIIFFDPTNLETIDQAYSIVSELMLDTQKLKDFYSQDVFLDSAVDELNKMMNNIQNIFDETISNILMAKSNQI